MNIEVHTIDGPVHLIAYANTGYALQINGAYTVIDERDEGEPPRVTGDGDTVQEAVDSYLEHGL